MNSNFGGTRSEKEKHWRKDGVDSNPIETLHKCEPIITPYPTSTDSTLKQLYSHMMIGSTKSDN